ncbi:MAG: superfamily II DNA or RNA helicase [Rhodothermales bacterium]|jgi:superfamily II DNA or RNA helicase
MTRLRVLTDFDHTPGRVCLWIQDADGHALTMQDLYNLALRRDSDEWEDDDRMLLKLLWQEVSRPYILKGNLKVLKLPKIRFDAWLMRFEDSPDRFVHAQGGAVRKEMAEGKLRFSLDGGGEKVTLAAIVDLPDGGSCQWHELRYRPQGKQACYLYGELPILVDLPIPREKLDQAFCKGPQQVSTAAVPSLFSKRLDLLSGTALDRSDDAEMRIAISDEGADIRLNIHGIVFRHQSGRLKLRLPPPALQAALHELSEQADTLIEGRPEVVSRFAENLRKLPPEIAISASPSLQGLLASGQCETELSIQQGSGWLDVDLHCRVDGIAVSGDELRAAVEGGHSCMRTRSGQWLSLPSSVAESYTQKLAELELAPGRQRIARVTARSVLAKLADFPDLRPRADAAALIKSLGAGRAYTCEITDDRLRSYQREGVAFIYERLACEMGCLLADDMGLGKTAQVLVATKALFESKHVSRALVVCPASVMAVWRKEAATFAPGLRMIVLDSGPEQRRKAFADSASWDIAVLSYAVVRNGFRELRKLGCDLLILDEAQAIKNPDAAVTAAVRRLEIPLRIAMTGTPLENSLDDLWSISDVLNPGYLGERRPFVDAYAYSQPQRKRLASRLAPLILRRRKSEVAPELPPRTEERLLLTMAPEQAELYQRELLRARQSVGTEGMPQMLAAITKLRQICCDPRLVDPSFGTESTKIVALRERLLELHEAGHSVLVFSQFTRMLDLVEESLAETAIPRFTIRGDTPAARRAGIVDSFSNLEGPAVFLLSLRAAGTGLTLTKADYVFLCDPWWNPAIENQAIDRTHRIGQGSPVTAYRLVMGGTIEEKVVDMQIEKQQLFTDVIEGAGAAQQGLTQSEMMNLLAANR